MLIYNYDRDTGAFLYASEPRLDLLETETRKAPHFLIPAYATVEPPPSSKPRWWPCWRDGAWRMVEDHRGDIWYTPEGRRVEIGSVGNPSDSGLLNENPRIILEIKWAARSALARSDIIVLRCFENDVKVPEEWKRYRSVLRDIIRSDAVDRDTVVPAAPAKPPLI